MGRCRGVSMAIIKKGFFLGRVFGGEGRKGLLNVKREEEKYLVKGTKKPHKKGKIEKANSGLDGSGEGECHWGVGIDGNKAGQGCSMNRT